MAETVKPSLADRDGAIELINKVFRTSRGHSPTMAEEFPYLLSEDNIENMTVIKDGEKIVSVVTHLPWDILIEGVRIKASSIGAVCTDEEYRGRGYSSIILDSVEEELKEKDIDLLLVSGTRSLYKRRGLVEVGSFCEYTIEPDSKPIELEVLDYSEEYLEELLHMYSQNSTRYFRTADEFRTILSSATIPWGTFKYKKYVLKESGRVAGYIVVRTEDDKTGSVVECFGEPQAVLNSLQTLSYRLNLSYIKYRVHTKDTRSAISNVESVSVNNQGTFKIVNFTALMEKLKPYFSQYVSEDSMKNLSFREGGDRLYIELEDEKISLSVSEATKLVFGGLEEKRMPVGGNADKIGKFINCVFPLPFSWTQNLNYQ